MTLCGSTKIQAAHYLIAQSYGHAPKHARLCKTAELGGHTAKSSVKPISCHNNVVLSVSIMPQSFVRC